MLGSVLELKRWHLAAGGALLCVVVGVLGVGCGERLSLWDISHVPHRGAEPVINMGEHLDREVELACVVCHPGAETEDRAGTPGRDLCLSCHGGLVSVGMFDLEGDFFDADGESKWTMTAALPEGIIFSHVGHGEFDCAECHGDIENDDCSLADLAGRFDNCNRCHLRDELAGRCDLCHSSLDESRRPHSHEAAWQRRHGRRVLGAGGTGLDDRLCRRCHVQSYCVKCHEETSPRDHTRFWVKAGHGLEGRMDRGRCHVCHGQDQCLRCHLEEAPPMPLDGDHLASTPGPCLAPGCHQDRQFGHVLLTQDCRFCHK